MQAAADAARVAATDLAEHLVRAGRAVPRGARARRRARARSSVERGVAARRAGDDRARLGPDALALLEPGSAVRRRTTPGGAGPEPVARAARRGARAARRSSALARRLTDAERRAWPRAAAVVLRPRRRSTLAPRAAQQAARARRARRRAGWRRGSSRSRPTAGRTTPGATRYRGRRRATRRCSARPGTCTCTSPTACTGARTSSRPRAR